MTTVYVREAYWADCNWVIGVYSTRELADAALDVDPFTNTSYETAEFVLDATPEKGVGRT
jgi:hypothetical protein